MFILCSVTFLNVPLKYYRIIYKVLHEVQGVPTMEGNLFIHFAPHSFTLLSRLA